MIQSGLNLVNRIKEHQIYPIGDMDMGNWRVIETFSHVDDEEYSRKDPDGYGRYCSFIRGLFDELRSYEESCTIEVG